MAVTKMKKFTLLAFHEHRDALLKELQKFGDVHFKDLQKEELAGFDFLTKDHSQGKIPYYESELAAVNATIAKLSPDAVKKPLTEKRPTLGYEEFDRYLESYPYKNVCEKVKQADDRIAAINSETARLKAENENLNQWSQLDISPAGLDKLTTVQGILGVVNKATASTLVDTIKANYDCVYIEFLNMIKDDTALLLLIPSSQYQEVYASLKDLGFAKTNPGFDGVPLELASVNIGLIQQAEQERNQMLEQIRQCAEEYERLLIVKDCLQTALAREKACENFMRITHVTVIEGWFPAKEEAAFQVILEKNCGQDYYLECEEVEPESTSVPIKLANNKVVSSFEDITAMYSMPLYREFDPTPIFAPCYWIFFGMMVGDIGYGFVMLAGTFLALKLLDLKDGMKKMLQMFFYLSFAVILVGFLYGGAFGKTVFTPLIGPDGNPKPILDSQQDIVTMLIISVAVGVLQILYGLVVKGVSCLKSGDIPGALFDSVFWIITLISGIGFLAGAFNILSPGVVKACKYVFFLSLVGLAATQGRDSPSLGGKIGNGLYGVYGLANYVGDIVSYTRITALALSGAYIGFSFNLMIGLLPGGPVRIIGGLLVGLAGHALNLGLSLLGAYVHTCRLQYVEFFGKFYEGGGVPYQPLKIQNDYIHIN